MPLDRFVVERYRHVTHIASTMTERARNAKAPVRAAEVAAGVAGAARRGR